jgi:hypothetical protein
MAPMLLVRERMGKTCGGLTVKPVWSMPTQAILSCPSQQPQRLNCGMIIVDATVGKIFKTGPANTDNGSSTKCLAELRRLIATSQFRSSD